MGLRGIFPNAVNPGSRESGYLEHFPGMIGDRDGSSVGFMKLVKNLEAREVWKYGRYMSGWQRNISYAGGMYRFKGWARLSYIHISQPSKPAATASKSSNVSGSLLLSSLRLNSRSFSESSSNHFLGLFTGSGDACSSDSRSCASPISWPS